MKGYVHLEPTTPSSQSREEYLASQETIEAMEDDQNQSTESDCRSTPANQSTESDKRVQYTLPWTKTRRALPHFLVSFHE